MAIPAIIPALLTFAPFLADLLGGDKAGKVAEKAVAVASGVLGLADGSADSVEQALRTLDPGKAAELRLALAKIVHDEKMADKAAERAEADRKHDLLVKSIEDVASARGMTVDLAKVGSKLAWGAAVVSVLIVLATAGMGYLIFNGKVPAENRDLALLFAGTLLGAFTSVTAFWLGSSAGSVQKTDTSAQLAALATAGGRK